MWASTPASSAAIRSTSSSESRRRASRATWRTCSRSIIRSPARRAAGARRAASPPRRRAAGPTLPTPARARSSGRSRPTGVAPARTATASVESAASSTVKTPKASGTAGEGRVSVAITRASPASAASAAGISVTVRACQASSRMPANSNHGRNSETPSSTAAGAASISAGRSRRQSIVTARSLRRPASGQAATLACAASMVLRSRHAIVIGPTPPGTGVIALARCAAASKSTSPTSPPSRRLTPTSITIAPSLTQSPLTICGRPIAAIRMSARAHTSASSRVREWHVVTVAFAPSSSAAIGLPNRFERPITTASAPSSCAPTLSSSSITPLGVHGRRPGRPSASSPADSGGQAVDVLADVDEAGHLHAVEVVGQRQLDDDPVDRRVGVEPLDRGDHLLLASRPRPCARRTSACRSPRTGAAWSRRRPRSPGRRRSAPSRGRAGARAARRTRPPPSRAPPAAPRRRPCRR